MKKVTTAVTVLGAAAALTMAAAAPAMADPWDGNTIPFGLGNWSFFSAPVNINDVDLVFPDTSVESTDIWDVMGYLRLTSAQLSLSNVYLMCAPVSTVDLTVDGDTGDLLITCTATNADLTATDLVANVEYRIYSTSDLVRVSVELVNTGDTDIAIDEFTFGTDFGSAGDLWGYQGQSDGVLPVPADENTTSMDALNTAGARWMVHFNEYDAPGGLAWGSGDAEAPARLVELSDDYSEASVSPFDVPAGESRTVAYFALWNPATLIDLGYENELNSGQAEAADALVPLMDEFTTFSGRLTVGLEGQQVVNWAPVSDEEPAKPQLAATGADTSGAALGFAAALLAAGALVLGAASRRRSVTARRG